MRDEAQHVIEALETLLGERLGKGAADRLATLLDADWGDAPLLAPDGKRKKKDAT